MIDQAITKAAHFLLAEAGKGFPEACHRMRFPHVGGFTGDKEVQQGDLFARAVLGRICADLARQASGVFDFSEPLGRIATREADYLAQGKAPDRAGGWSYFPGLPELPPDLDSLAAAIRLFVACAPHYLHLCEEPVALALGRPGGVRGLPSTWIIAPNDPPAAQEAMTRGISLFWGEGVDIDPLAHFFLALAEWDRDRFDSVLALASTALAQLQRADGRWDASWYCGPWFVGFLCLQFLHLAGAREDVQRKGLSFLVGQQRPDGGWGEQESTPLETAIVLILLRHSPHHPIRNRAIDRGRELLLEHQATDGSWNPSPWIKMVIGRCGGNEPRFITWHSTTITSAFCLQALVHTR
jgi:squalene-hopene/tetraprenyl-beta-curcumene cyclase